MATTVAEDTVPPVTLLSGFLGAGKTSMLTSILQKGGPLRSWRGQGRLRKLCRDAGHTPEVLGAVMDLPLDQACAREMQLCRQKGQHKLVISLGETAVAMGLDHPRIRNNLTRSKKLLRREARLAKIQRLLQGKRSSRDRAEACP